MASAHGLAYKEGDHSPYVERGAARGLNQTDLKREVSYDDASNPSLIVASEFDQPYLPRGSRKSLS